MIKITKKEFERASPLGKSAHPDEIMRGIIKTVTSVGVAKFLHGAGFNKDRDSFVAVLFSYAIRKWSKREWFIQQIQDPPDFYIISPTDRPLKEKPMDRIGVEIVEIRDETVELAIKTLDRTKLTNYTPDTGTVLLIFINSKIDLLQLRDLNIWIARNQNKFTAFSEVYILFLNGFTQELILSFTLINALKAWSESSNLKEEFNKGIIYPHKLIDDHKVKFLD